MWRAWLHSRKKSAERSLLAGLLLGHLILALAYSAINPLGETPDEADHWAYVVYLAQQHSLPSGPQVTQSKHPPLYHASAALIADLLATPASDFLRANPDLRVPTPPEGPVNFFIHTALESWPWRGGPLAFHLARGWSIFLSLGTIGAAYGLMRTAFPGKREVALTVAGVLAFLPTFAFIGSSVSNDGAAALFATAALWGGFAIYRSGGNPRAGWWTPLALGLGLLTKVSTLAIWPPVALLVATPFFPASVASAPIGFVAWPRRTERGWRTLPRLSTHLRTQLAVFLPAGLIAAPWFWRNWHLYGDPLGLSMARQTIDQRLNWWTWSDSWWLFKGWFLSFWGRFGAIGQIAQPAWADWLLLLLTLASAAGLARLLMRTQRHDFRFPVTVLLLTVISTGVVMWQYSQIALGTDQGRLLYPALGPIVGLWVLGLWTWVGRGWLLVAATGLWNIAILAGVIHPAYSPASVIANDAPLPAIETIDFGEIQIVGADLAHLPVLYWTAAQRPRQDWRAVLRITAGDGTLIWEWERSPGEGRFATDRWPAGVVVRDAYAVQWPDWAGPGRYRVEVGLHTFAGVWALPKSVGMSAIRPDHPFVELGWIEYSP